MTKLEHKTDYASSVLRNQTRFCNFLQVIRLYQNNHYLLPIAIITIMMASNLGLHYSRKVCCTAIVFRCVKCFRQWHARVRGTVYSLTSIMVAVMGVRVCLTR